MNYITRWLNEFRKPSKSHSHNPTSSWSGLSSPLPNPTKPSPIRVACNESPAIVHETKDFPTDWYYDPSVGVFLYNDDNVIPHRRTHNRRKRKQRNTKLIFGSLYFSSRNWLKWRWDQQNLPSARVKMPPDSKQADNPWSYTQTRSFITQTDVTHHSIGFALI